MSQVEPKRAVLVKGGIVHDVVMPGPGYQPPKGSALMESETANVGDKHQGGGRFVTVDPPEDKEGLKAYARFTRSTAIKSGLDFNIADAGSDPKIVRIPTDNITREEIRELAWLTETTGENATLVLPDQVLTLSPKQIFDLRQRIAEHIARSHHVAAKLVENINSAHIGSKREIEAPETATAVKLMGWHKPHG